MTSDEALDFLQRFENQADLAPEAPALLHGRQTLTYRQLDERANQLAHHLRRLGVGPDVLVAICIERSPEMAIAVLAVLKAGGAYVPLDANYPGSRLTFMLEDTRAPVLLTQRRLLETLPPTDARAICLDEGWALLEGEPKTRPSIASDPDHLAYVIYTSGSTGQPKGVAMRRGALDNLIAWQLGDSAMGEGARTLQFSPLSFDVSFQEAFATWCSGGTLVLITDELRLDAVRLLQFIEEHRIDRLFLPFIALQSLAEIADAQGLVPRSLKEVITAGEQLLTTAHIARFFERLPACTLHNHYGPSETHVVTAYRLGGSPSTWPALPPIGRPLPHTSAYILNESGKPVPEGETGELFLGGVCLARGYLNRPELTAEKFVADPFSAAPGARMYRTGDLAKRQRDGNIDFLGRIDGQVKVRGYRIELGEIEVALGSHEAVKQAVVIAREDEPGDKRLVAYLVLDAARDGVVAELRKHLLDRVPDYMVPSAFVVLETLPRTPSGKIDRRALPKPTQLRPDLASPYVAPRDAFERTLAGIWATLLKIDRVGIDDNFFELGGNSLLALKSLARLRQDADIEVPIVQLYQQPTLAGLSARRAGGEAPFARRMRERKERTHAPKGPGSDIAIIAMAGRFPGADTISSLWSNLCGGVESIRVFTDDELDPSISPAIKADPRYVKARGVLDGVDQFDAAFFGISPKEAELMDPQQRLFLEVAHETLEKAGCVPEHFAGLVGVFAGIHNNSYWPENIATRPDLVEQLGAFTAMVGNEKDYVATRVAHRLNLTGLAISIHTACSTSLVAVCQAVAALQARQCDVALAGGASLTVPQKSGYLYQEGAMLSGDGHCRPFDAKAQGTLFSDGVGAVALKRLDDALADGDVIHAVIKGTALNNDGANKASFTAPSVDGQATVIALAQQAAGVDARSIGYVEAHGTATPLGDPIEVEALTQAFRQGTPDVGFCALGSIKSNFGHLTAAAGVTGLIKAALVLEREQIPPTLHFDTPNPKIDFDHSPFVVARRLQDWKRSSTPRRAAVSSFGVGGTNAHAVLEEAPVRLEGSASRPRQLLVISAKTRSALEAATKNLADALASSPAASLPDVAYTLQTGRRAFAHRRVVACATPEEGASLLRSLDPSQVLTRAPSTKQPELAFMFPGQGSQYVNMGRSLYRDEPIFRVVIDQCAEGLLPHLGKDLRTLMYPAAGDEAAAAAALKETSITQPALFAIEYALANLYLSWGFKPAAMIGHSIGEFVAACLAGVFTLEDALKLVASRGRLMQDLPGGTMLSVRLAAKDVEPRLTGQLAIASDNGPSLCVVAGPYDEAGALQAKLEAEGVVCRPLHTSHAFHSPMMDPVIEPFAQIARKISLSAPRIPFVSTVTGTWITAEQATDPMYWARHLRATVRFSDGVKELWKAPGRVLLEVGPRNTLATLARQQMPEKQSQAAIASLSDTPENEAEWTHLLRAVGHLWTCNVPVAWDRLWEHEQRRKVVLPTYPFERKRFWVEPAPRAVVASSVHSPQSALVATGEPAMPSPPAPTTDRRDRLVPVIKELLADTSGLDLDSADPETTFLDLGFDSLVLTQVALTLQKHFNVKITFRQLLEEQPNMALLAKYVDEKLPREEPAAAAPAPAAPPAVVAAPATPHGAPGVPMDVVQNLIDQQLRVMAQQLELLGRSGRPASVAGMTAAAPAAAPTAAPAAVSSSPAAPEPDGPLKAEPYDPKKAFGAIARIHLRSDEMTPKQRARFDAFTRRYTARTKASKQFTQDNRAHLADPRVVTGFKPHLKEIIYQVVVNRSKGSKVWDIDGNEYVDALNGFGSNFFGYSAEFIVDAVQAQLEAGYELGPQHPHVGEAAKLFCELTHYDRAGFCNTGSEAVMGALRMARTITGRSTVVCFNGSYHGIFDEVIVRGSKKLRPYPAAPGILPESVQNMLVLDYGTPESLQIIRERAHELAAVLVEPVQSRRPDFHPREFLHDVRAITEKSGSALIFDEVITGFRMGPGGAQDFYGISADIGTYGKVVGGGMPIGVIAGKRKWMDALDGGHWQFGDASVPTVGPTYFAGTFVRHPLALAAAVAVLRELKDKGPALQAGVTAKLDAMADELNAHFHSVGAPIKIKHFASLWKTFFTEDLPYAELLFPYLRDRGVHIWDGFPCFLTTAHTDADVAFIVKAYKDAVAELQESGFLPGETVAAGASTTFDASAPPAPGARLGKDPEGNPAWYVPNPAEPGKYMKLGLGG